MACALPIIPMLKSNRPAPINTGARLAALWVTPLCGQLPDASLLFTPAAPPGHPGASPGASDGTDASLPFQSSKKHTKKIQAQNWNRYLPTHVHSSMIHNSQNLEATQVSVNG